MAAKFVIYYDKARKFRFRLVAPNGEIIAVGEDYESKASCLNGIKSIQKNAPIAPIHDETIKKEAAKKPAAVKAPVKKPAAPKAVKSASAAGKPAAKKESPEKQG